jgi:uncharacterized protein YdhG (YjbR/CyaY superfamily)
MAERKAATKSRKTSAKRTTSTAYKGFSAEERAAMKERARELKAEERWKKDRAAGEKAVLDKIATMPGPDRTMAKRLHAIIKAAAPDLSPKTWYGMPAYVNQDGKVVCFFQSGDQYKSRYSTFGFQDAANLDEGKMWPTSFALEELTPAEEKKIAALVKKAVR